MWFNETFRCKQKKRRENLSNDSFFSVCILFWNDQMQKKIMKRNLIKWQNYFRVFFTEPIWSLMRKTRQMTKACQIRIFFNFKVIYQAILTSISDPNWRKTWIRIAHQTSSMAWVQTSRNYYHPHPNGKEGYILIIHLTIHGKENQTGSRGM